MPPRYVIAVVLDVNFGERLFQFANGMPVWIVDTSANRAAAEKQWARTPAAPHTDGVTTFKVDLNLPAQAWLADVLPMVDLHHGGHSHVPYDALEVIGIEPDQAVRHALAEYGLTEIRENLTGFTASRNTDRNQ